MTKIILSNPEVTFLTDENNNKLSEIIYFYYDITFKRLDKFKNKWEKIYKGYVHDSSMIVYLPEMIDNILKADVKKKGFRCNNENAKAYRYIERCESITNEDVYKIEKALHYVDDKKITFYELFIGVGCGNENYTFGVSYKYLNKKDLKKVKKWAETFIKMGIDKENGRGDYYKRTKD